MTRRRRKPYDPLHHSRRAQTAKAAMFRIYGHTCWICNHPGAHQADLIIPRATAPQQAITPHAYRPAHGGGRPDNPCPTCGRRCNQERGTAPAVTIWRPRLQW